MSKGFKEGENASRPDIELKGEKNDSLSSEAAQEFHEIEQNWDAFSDPVQQLDRWCDHYYGRKHIPINFALKLWKNENAREAVWPYVEEEFRGYIDKLDQHGASPELIEDIKSRLGN